MSSKTRSWNGSSWCPRWLRLAIYIRDGFRCVHCSQDLSGVSPDQINLDHIIPWSLGGSDEASNLVTSCASCNKIRQDKPISKFHRGNRSAQSRVYAAARKALNISLSKSLLKASGEAEGDNWIGKVQTVRSVA